MRGEVLVTGGGSGIGQACARRLLSDGASVTIAGRDPERLAGALDALRRHSDGARRLRSVVCDVTDADAVADAVAVAADGGTLRAVVAAPGRGWVAPLTTISPQTWRDVLDVTLTSVFLTLRAAVPHLARPGGVFAAISSVNARRTARFHTPYCTAKAGVDMLVRTAADELGAAGIRVVAVEPGLVPTDLSAGVVADDETRDDFLQQTPLGRLGTVDDVAAAVGFLVSDAASWVTGVCLPVDGGQHLRRGQRFDAFVRRDHPDAPAWWGIAPSS